MPAESLTALAVVVVALVAVFVALEVRRDPRGRIAAVAAIATLALATSIVLLNGNAQPQAATPTSTHQRISPPPRSVPPAASERAPAASVEPTVVRYEVVLAAGQYVLFEVDGEGTVTPRRTTSFAGSSIAPVDRVEATNGLVHWRTVVGDFVGLSYVAEQSGPFQVRAVLRWPDGSTGSREVDPGS